MSRTDDVLSLMNELKDLMEREKHVLIENDGAQLFEILEEKDSIIEKLTTFDDENVELEKLSDLSREIKELQETNLMLTEQSMAYTEVILNNIQKNAQKKNAYSKKGTIEKSDRPTFLDESL